MAQSLTVLTIICLFQDVQYISQFQGQLIWLLSHIRMDTLYLGTIYQWERNQLTQSLQPLGH